MIIWTFRIQKLKIGSLADFEKKSFSSLFLMRKPLSSDQKWFLRPYFPLIGGIFVLKSGLRFLFRALEVPIWQVRKRPFLRWTQPSGPLCLWQCFQISGLARAGYNQEGPMEVFPLIYGFLYVRQLPLIPACLLLVWILQALQLLGLEFPLNSAPPLSSFSARCLIICLKSQVSSQVSYFWIA